MIIDPEKGPEALTAELERLAREPRERFPISATPSPPPQKIEWRDMLQAIAASWVLALILGAAIYAVNMASNALGCSPFLLVSGSAGLISSLVLVYIFTYR